MKTYSINKDILDSSSPGSILGSGSFIDDWEFNIATTGKSLTWVAVRWGIPDWCVYYSNPYWEINLGSIETIKRIWDKMSKDMARKLFKEVTPEAFEMYRS